MPLIAPTLKLELQKIFDQESPNFEGFPDSLEGAAQRWAEAFDIYAKEVIPFSTTNEAAKSAFISTFMGINFSNGRIQFPLCFVAYATALAPGMLPAFAGTPPIGIPVFDPIYAVGMSGGTSEQCIDMMVNILDIWMRTGIAVNTSTSVTINWS